MNKIKLGIVGLGRAGWGMHFEELKAYPDLFEIAAVCDLLPDRTKKAEDRCGCKTYDKIEDLIADENVEIVVIATRTCDHYRHAMMALKAGKDVFLEKPMCQNVKEAEELFASANKPGKPRLFIRQNRRYELAFNNVKDTIASGKLGNVFEITIEQIGYQRRDDWQTLTEFGGGQLLNWGPHIIDHALRLLDAPVKEQFGLRTHAVAGGDAEDHFSIHFIGENGRKVNVWISGATALRSGRYFTVYGTKGAMVIHNSDVEVKYIDPAQKLPPVISSSDTPGASFGKSGTFEAAVNPNWIEEKYTLSGEDLTQIWKSLYESYRNGADFPIKPEEVLALMTAVTKLREQDPIIDMTDKQ